MSFLDHLAGRVLDPDASLAPMRAAVFRAPNLPTDRFTEAPAPRTERSVSVQPDAAPMTTGMPAAPAPVAVLVPARQRRYVAAPSSPPPSGLVPIEPDLPSPAVTAATSAVDGPEEIREHSVETVHSAAPLRVAAASSVEQVQETIRIETAAIGTPTPPIPAAPAAPLRDDRPVAAAIAPPPPATPRPSTGLLARQPQAVPPPSSQPLAAMPPPPPAPVHISIGRIEVRAPAAAPAPPRKSVAATAPVLSLSDYLGGRGARR